MCFFCVSDKFQSSKKIDLNPLKIHLNWKKFDLNHFLSIFIHQKIDSTSTRVSCTFLYINFQCCSPVASSRMCFASIVVMIGSLSKPNNPLWACFPTKLSGPHFPVIVCIIGRNLWVIFSSGVLTRWGLFLVVESRGVNQETNFVAVGSPVTGVAFFYSYCLERHVTLEIVSHSFLTYIRLGKTKDGPGSVTPGVRVLSSCSRALFTEPGN